MHKDKNTREINVINKSLRLMMDDDLINLLDKQRKKLEKNAKKYPVDKAKGSAAKYTEL